MPLFSSSYSNLGQSVRSTGSRFLNTRWREHVIQLCGAATPTPAHILHEQYALFSVPNTPIRIIANLVAAHGSSNRFQLSKSVIQCHRQQSPSTDLLARVAQASQSSTQSVCHLVAARCSDGGMGEVAASNSSQVLTSILRVSEPRG